MFIEELPNDNACVEITDFAAIVAALRLFAARPVVATTLQGPNQ